MSQNRRLSRKGVSPLDDFAFLSRQADSPDPDTVGEESEVELLAPEGWDARNIAALVALSDAQPGDQLHAGHVLGELAELLSQDSEVERDEMLRVFNMGVGMIVLVAPEDVDRVLEGLSPGGGPAWVMGEVEAREGVRWA